MSKIAIIGNGQWGSALKFALRSSAGEVQIFGRHDPLNILDAHYIILAVPSAELKDLFIKLSKLTLNKDTVIIIATKGVESETGELFSSVARQLLPHKIAILAGPNFAHEVLAGKFTASNLALENDLAFAKQIAEQLSSPNFRIIPTDDFIGLQITGAMKNIMAIWAGCCSAKLIGDNARSYIMTLGAAEITKLATAMADASASFCSLGFFGDYYLTTSCTSSRNYKFGVDLVANEGDIINFIQNYPNLVEGRSATYGIIKLAGKYQISLPLTRLLNDIFAARISINGAITQTYSL